METHLAYCAALDREVRVFLRPVGYDDTDATIDEAPGLVCLEHSEACLGVRCPLLDKGVESMERFVRWPHR